MAKTSGSSTAVLNAIKQRSKGAWEQSKTVAPKAKGLTSLPGGITNGIGRIVGSSLKMTDDKGKGSSPMVTLKFIVREPLDYEGAQIFKFYIFKDRTGDFPKTIGEIMDDFSSDIQLLGAEPKEIDDWPEMLADLQSAKPYFVYNTWKPPGEGGVQIFIQRLCSATELKAFAASPTEAPENAEEVVAAAEAGEPAPKAPPKAAGRKGPPPKAPPKAAPAPEEPEEVVEVVDEEPVEEVTDKQVPEPGDRCYVVVKGEQRTCDIVTVDADNKFCICQDDEALDAAGKLKKYKITFEQLEKMNPSE